jgi:ketosteroid isomerase-like protein
MTMTQPAGATAEHHPFTAALSARDVEALIDSLAPDAELHSAITGVAIKGPELLADLYGPLIESFEDLRVTDVLVDGDAREFSWEGRIDGRHVEGADRILLGPDGKVRRITIVGRPLLDPVVRWLIRGTPS